MFSKLLKLGIFTTLLLTFELAIADVRCLERVNDCRSVDVKEVLVDPNATFSRILHEATSKFIYRFRDQEGQFHAEYNEKVRFDFDLLEEQGLYWYRFDLGIHNYQIDRELKSLILFWEISRHAFIRELRALASKEEEAIKQALAACQQERQNIIDFYGFCSERQDPAPLVIWPPK